MESFKQGKLGYGCGKLQMYLWFIHSPKQTLAAVVAKDGRARARTFGLGVLTSPVREREGAYENA